MQRAAAKSRSGPATAQMGVVNHIWGGRGGGVAGALADVQSDFGAKCAIRWAARPARPPTYYLNNGPAKPMDHFPPLPCRSEPAAGEPCERRLGGRPTAAAWAAWADVAHQN